MLEHVLASLNRHGARWVYCLAGCGVGRGEKTCARRRGAKDRAHGSSPPQPLATCGPKRGRDQAGDAGRAESATRRLARRRGSALKRFRHSYSLVQQHMFLRSRGAFFAPRFYFLLRAPEFRGGGAPRDVPVLARHRLGLHVTRQARHLARRLASHDAGRPPLGAPPWRFWAPVPRFLLRHLLRIRSASSSQPGHSAWRTGSRASRDDGSKPPPRDATPRSAFRYGSRTRPERAKMCVCGKDAHTVVKH